MRVVAEKEGKYLYALEFPFDWDIINHIRAIKTDPTQPALSFIGGKWRFSDLGLLPRLKAVFPNLSVSTEIEVAAAKHATFKTGDERRRQRAAEIKSKLTTDFVVNGVKGELYGYQKAAVEFLVNADGRGLIADEMGVGKTASALGYIAHTGVKKTLVVCPAVVRGVWRKEILKWTKLKSNVIEPSTRLTIDMWNASDVHIISYHSLKKHFEALKAFKIDALICDESHRCLPYGSKVTTLSGALSIGDIVNRDEDVYVASCNPLGHVLEYRKVVGKSRRLRTDPMVVIKHEYGEFTCTENHRVWTDSGYKEAIRVSSGDTLLALWENEASEKEREIHSQVLQPALRRDVGVELTRDADCPRQEATEAGDKEEVPHLQEDVQLPLQRNKNERKKNLLRRILLGQVADVIPRKAELVQGHYGQVEDKEEIIGGILGVRETQEDTFGEDDQDEQGQKFSCSGNGRGEKVEEDPPHVPAQRGKRASHQGTNSSLHSAEFSGGLDGTRHTYVSRSAQVRVPTPGIQGGSSPSAHKTGYRGRRRQSPDEEMAVSGQEKRRSIISSRVESVKVLEQGSEQGAGEGGGGDPFVYSIEVEGNHNYFADGLLVANCKEPKTQWTKLVIMLSRNIPRFIALTGTPVLSRPRELFTTMHAIAPQEFPDMWKFFHRYGDPKKTSWGWKFDGATNQEELKSRIETFFIRRTKAEVLPFLPPKVYVDVPLPLDDETDDAYALAEKDFVSYLEGNRETRINVATALTRMMELRRLASVGKISGVIDFVENLIESGKKVILFSAFNEPLKELADYFGNQAVMIIGETSGADRDIAVDRFQEDASVKLFLGGLISASEGVTLTAADTTVFIDRDWVPAHRLQAEARMHRPGTKHTSVTIYDVYTEGTIDEVMKDVSDAKMAVFDKLFGDSTGAEKEMVSGVLDSYRKKDT